MIEISILKGQKSIVLAALLVIMAFAAVAYAAGPSGEPPVSNITPNFGGLNVSGQVGVGTTTPWSLFDIRHPYPKTNTANIIYPLQIRSNEAANYSALTISTQGGATQAVRHWDIQTDERGVANAGNLNLQSSGGKVGIGTVSPATPLHVTSGMEGGIRITASTAPRIDLYGTYPDAGVRNWMFRLDNVVFGDFGIYQSSVKDGDPRAGTSRLYIQNDGDLGIGTTTPGAKLDVVGTVKITDGTQGAGKVLTSDADGLASWETATAGGGGDTLWTADGTNIYNANTGSVGVGTTTPGTGLSSYYTPALHVNTASGYSAVAVRSTDYGRIVF